MSDVNPYKPQVREVTKEMVKRAITEALRAWLVDPKNTTSYLSTDESEAFTPQQRLATHREMSIALSQVVTDDMIKKINNT